MKTILLVLSILLISADIFSQESFDKGIESVGNDLAAKLLQQNKTKVAILYIKDIEDVETLQGKYMADIVGVAFVNNPGKFVVWQRVNLNGLAEAQKLIDAGYIDAANAKLLGKILSADALITGRYMVKNNSVKLILNAFDVSSGTSIAASSIDLPGDETAVSIFGTSFSEKEGAINKGYGGQPLNSNEIYNSDRTVSQECKEKKTGTYCFLNSTKFRAYVRLDTKNGSRNCTLQPGETQCFYAVLAGEIYYRISFYGTGTPDDIMGYLLVEQCKSKTFQIKLQSEKGL